MGKCQANDVGSVVLGRPAPAPLPGGGGHFKLLSASLRRIVLDTVRCGGGRQKQHAVSVKSTTEELKPRPKTDLTTLRSELKKHSTAGINTTAASGSDKLSDLLRLSEFSEKENEEEEEEVVRRKVEALEDLKRVVRNVQTSQEENGLIRVLEGAREIRKLTKDDPESRTTLASLGAIPPLVALLDSPDLSSQIAALYALLNIGIGNDA